MKVLYFLCCMLFSSWACATKVADKPLDEMVDEASEIAIAHVEKFVGRRNNGTLVTQGEFRTGPGLGNTAIASVRIVEVLKGAKLQANTIHQVELYPAWHMQMNLSGPLDGKHNVIVFLKQSESGLVPVFEPEPYLGDYLEQDVRKLLRLRQKLSL